MRWAFAALVIAYFISTPTLYAFARPVSRALSEGEAGSEEVRRRGAQRALSLPLLNALQSFTLWMATGLSYAIVQRVFAPELRETTQLVMQETVVVGIVTSTFVHYVTEAGVRQRLLPVLLGDRDATSVGRVFHLSLGGKIGVLVLTASVVPAVHLALMHRHPWVGPLAMLYVGLTFAALGILQGVVITRSVIAPLTEVTRAQRRVANHDLDVHVLVRSADQVGRLAEGFDAMVAGLRRGEQIKNTFGVYVHPRLVDDLLAGKVALAGELRPATVLFADIRGFTALSERLKPEEVVTFLNRYLDLMVRAIVDAGGTVDKFIGDGIMAAFGAPLQIDEPDVRAVRAGLEMLEQLKVFNVEWTASGQSPMAIGIGIHSGDVVAGSIGSAKKMQYTLIGDTVNTASRIEELTKAAGAPLLVSEETWRRLNGRARGTSKGPMAVKGKSRPIEVFEVTGLSG